MAGNRKETNERGMLGPRESDVQFPTVSAMQFKSQGAWISSDEELANSQKICVQRRRLFSSGRLLGGFFVLFPGPGNQWLFEVPMGIGAILDAKKSSTLDIYLSTLASVSIIVLWFSRSMAPLGGQTS